jgi:uncharacterized protein (TIGR03067 family)
LVSSTVNAARLFAAAKTVTAGASVKVVTLAEGVMRAMFLTKMKTAIVVVATVLGLGTGLGLLTGISRNAVVAQEDKGKPPPPAAAKFRVQELIQQLNADEFQKRERATKELKALGKEIVPQLEAALQTNDSAEVRRRLEQLIALHRPQTDLEILQGTWSLVEAHRFGNKVPVKDLPTKDIAYGRHALVIAGKKIAIVLHNGGGDPYGKFKLDTTRKPKELRVNWSIPAWFCIYKVEGDALTICMNENTNLPLPDEFRTMAESERMLFVYHREKPNQEPKKEGAPKLDFGVPPGDGLRVPVQDDRREFRVPVQDDRREFRVPVQDDRREFRVPVQDDRREFRVPVQDDRREFRVPVQDDRVKPKGDAGGLIWSLQGHSAAVYFAAFSPNGETLVTTAKGITKTPRADELIIWDVTAQKAKHKIQFQAPVHIWSMTLSADGKTVAVGTPVGIELRDAENGKTKHMLNRTWPLSTGPCSLAFAPNSKILASGGSARDHIVRLWDVEKGELIRMLRGHTDEVSGLSFSPDGKTLASTGGMNDTTVRYWDVATGQLRVTVNSANEESKDGTEAVDGNWQSWPMAFSPDGKILARGRGSHVKFWEARTGEVKGLAVEGSHHPNTTVQSIAFSPDGKLVAGGRESGVIDVWETRPADGKHDWRIGDLKQTFKNEHSHPVMALAFSSSGELLASGDQDGKVRVWKMATCFGADQRQIFEFYMGFFR